MLLPGETIQRGGRKAPSGAVGAECSVLLVGDPPSPQTQTAIVFPRLSLFPPTSCDINHPFPCMSLPMAVPSRGAFLDTALREGGGPEVPRLFPGLRHRGRPGAIPSVR